MGRGGGRVSKGLSMGMSPSLVQAQSPQAGLSDFGPGPHSRQRVMYKLYADGEIMEETHTRKTPAAFGELKMWL